MHRSTTAWSLENCCEHTHACTELDWDRKMIGDCVWAGHLVVAFTYIVHALGFAHMRSEGTIFWDVKFRSMAMAQAGPRGRHWNLNDSGNSVASTCHKRPSGFKLMKFLRYVGTTWRLKIYIVFFFCFTILMCHLSGERKILRGFIMFIINAIL